MAANRWRLSLRSLLSVVFIFCVYFAVRTPLPYVWWKGAVFSAAIAMVMCLHERRETAFFTPLLKSVLISTVGASLLGIAIAESLRAVEYWNWSHDWPIFCAWIGWHAVVAGLTVIVVWTITSIFKSSRPPVLYRRSDN